jgi:hypothetical protein
MEDGYLPGHYNYYGLPGNGQRLKSMYDVAIRCWRKSLSQRSQKGNVLWEELHEILKRHPILLPKLHITYASLPRYVML